MRPAGLPGGGRSAARPSPPSRLGPLRSRNYALYWVGLACSNTGRWIEVTGSIWLLYELTSSPAALAVLGVVTAIPTLIVQPLAGVIVDRVDHKRLLLLTQALAILGSLVLWLLVVLGLVQAWHIYVEVAFGAVVASFDVSVRQAFFPRLVPRDQLSDAVTLNSTAGRSSALIGPAIGGILIATYGSAAPYLVNAVTFLGLIAAVLLMHGIAPIATRARAPFGQALSQGMRYMLDAPVLRGLLKLELVFGIFQLNPVVIAVIGREILDVGPAGLGGLLAAPALGSIPGLALLILRGQPGRGGRFVVACQIAYAAGLVAIGLSHSYAVTFVLLALVGFLDVLTTVVRNSLTQLAAPGEMRGRIVANMRVVTGGVGPLAQTQSGILASVIGAPGSLAVAAVALFASASSTVWQSPALWRFSRHDWEVEPEVEPEVVPPAVTTSAQAGP